MAEVKEEHKNSSGNGVYYFVRDLIVEGKDAWLVDDKGRFALNWLTTPWSYADYKGKVRSELNERKASNNLRSALLNSYEKEGAKEYKESQKKNAEGKICERQFQMPPRIAKLLFGIDVVLSDDDNERETDSAASDLEACKSSEETPDSSDTGFEEMDTSCDDDLHVISYFTHFWDDTVSEDPVSSNITTSKMPDNSEALDSAFRDFLSYPISSDADDQCLSASSNTNDAVDQLQRVVKGICPESGPLEGGQKFVITLTEELSADDVSGNAHFQGIGDVSLVRESPFTLVGKVPASQQPGPVPVIVSTQAGRWLGTTCFTYEDEMEKMVMQLVNDQAKLASFLTRWSTVCGNLGWHSDIAQILLGLSPQDQDETDSESGQTEDDDNQSDYFADVETSSCGSYELDVGWSDSEDGEGPCSTIGTPATNLSRNSNPCTSFNTPSEVGKQFKDDAENEDFEETCIISFEVEAEASKINRWQRNDCAHATANMDTTTQENRTLFDNYFQTVPGIENKTSQDTWTREQEEESSSSQDETAIPKGDIKFHLSEPFPANPELFIRGMDTGGGVYLLKEEKQQFAPTLPFPEQDETSPLLETSTPSGSLPKQAAAKNCHDVAERKHCQEEEAYSSEDEIANPKVDFPLNTTQTAGSSSCGKNAQAEIQEKQHSNSNRSSKDNDLFEYHRTGHELGSGDTELSCSTQPLHDYPGLSTQVMDMCAGSLKEEKQQFVPTLPFPEQDETIYYFVMPECMMHDENLRVSFINRASRSSRSAGGFRRQSDDKDGTRYKSPPFHRAKSVEEVSSQAPAVVTTFLTECFRADGLPVPQELSENEQKINKDVAHALRDIGDRLSNDTSLNSLLSQLVVTKDTPYDSFLQVAAQIFQDGVINWGRIVTLFYLGYKLAVQVINQIPLIKMVIQWVVQFIEDRLAKWIFERGGWDLLPSVATGTPARQPADGKPERSQETVSYTRDVKFHFSESFLANPEQFIQGMDTRGASLKEEKHHLTPTLPFLELEEIYKILFVRSISTGSLPRQGAPKNCRDVAKRKHSHSPGYDCLMDEFPVEEYIKENDKNLPDRWKPEVLRENSCSTTSDVWAFGSLLYEMLTSTRNITEDDQVANYERLVRMVNNITESEKQQAQRDLIELQESISKRLNIRHGDKLNELRRDSRGAHGIGTTTGLVGGSLAVLLITGAATPLLAGIVLAGTGTNLVTSIRQASVNSKEIKKAEKLLQETLDSIQDVNENVQLSLYRKEKAKMVYMTLLAVHSLQLSDPVVKILQNVVVASDLRRSGTSTAGNATEERARTGSHARSKVSSGLIIGVSAASDVFDAIDLGFNIRDIVNNKGSEAAKFLREKADELDKDFSLCLVTNTPHSKPAQGEPVKNDLVLNRRRKDATSLTEHKQVKITLPLSPFPVVLYQNTSEVFRSKSATKLKEQVVEYSNRVDTLEEESRDEDTI